jgi:hypothetical protein
MNNSQRWIVIIVGALIMLHSLFPPRVAKDDELASGGRDFIGYLWFHGRKVREVSTEDTSKRALVYMDSRVFVIDWPRYVCFSVALLGFGLLSFGIATEPQKPQKANKSCEATGDNVSS